MPGGTTTSPSGFSRSLAIFATSLEVPMPTEPVQAAGGLVHVPLESAGDLGHARHRDVVEAGGGEVDERLVERERLHQR